MGHEKIGSLKKALAKYFAMKDMGPAKQILGMHIVQLNKEVVASEIKIM